MAARSYLDISDNSGCRPETGQNVFRAGSINYSCCNLASLVYVRRISLRLYGTFISPAGPRE